MLYVKITEKNYSSVCSYCSSVTWLSVTLLTELSAAVFTWEDVVKNLTAF